MWPNNCIIGVIKGEERENGQKQYSEIIDENFPKLMKDINLPVQELQPTSSRINTKKSTFRHIIVKFLKTSFRKQILKTSRGKKIHYT